MIKTNPSWTIFRPTLLSQNSRKEFLAYGRLLCRLPRNDSFEASLSKMRAAFLEKVKESRRLDRQHLLASGLVLSDLALQGWHVRIRTGCLQVSAPAALDDDSAAEKERVRRQELLKRDAQLRDPSVQKFILSMERTRIFKGTFTSIFSLMRDGGELSDALRKARRDGSGNSTINLVNIIDPYLKVIRSEATCPFTGLRLIDIWRYFRHTWSNQYTSIPGRTMMFLVRDRAAAFHPVIGIGAISSPVMQIRERDMWIGWHPKAFLSHARSNPTMQVANWLVETLDKAIAEIYLNDFFEDGVLRPNDLANPSDVVIRRLIKEGVEQRLLHHRYARSREHKRSRPRVIGTKYWITRARTHLFRSKRALALASYLTIRKVFKTAFGRHPTSKKLADLISTGQGKEVIAKVVKKAKADRVGIAVADITVCGAIQPYNALLGGKLVAMLSTSPEIVLEYKERYSTTPSEIASSMAGRGIVRTPMLVLLGTTSLYGVGSSQYNRITIPCDRLGNCLGEEIHYNELGHSESFGTSQYSEETIRALEDVVQQSEEGRRVNSIFGEGVSPKLRKVRQALDILGLSSEVLLRHHRKRVVYGVSLIRNLYEYLLGFDSTPKYFFPVESGVTGSAQIAAWWSERWLSKRINSDEVLEKVARHTLVRPIRHGARVVNPESSDELSLFP